MILGADVGHRIWVLWNRASNKAKEPVQGLIYDFNFDERYKNKDFN